MKSNLKLAEIMALAAGMAPPGMLAAMALDPYKGVPNHKNHQPSIRMTAEQRAWNEAVDRRRATKKARAT